ncbi:MULTISPECIES: septum formation family protein [unclassified Pseudoclavibacter]|uniref:septum formation family protein n=1 Tax=unclassified Pseudoclavibacter TaxID=2615177 RepID=UPI0011B0A514|nr:MULTISPECIES: septum formation family protein [unclassified Pseudoclavibacter]
MAHRLPATLLTALLAGAALTACTASPDAPRMVPITELSAGDCFSSNAEQTVATIAGSCDTPHLYQVLSIAPSELGEGFPGEEALTAEADAQCAADFAGLGSNATAGLTALHLVPSEASWAEGDRDLACLVASSDGAELTGSQVPAGS